MIKNKEIRSYLLLSLSFIAFSCGPSKTTTPPPAPIEQQSVTPINPGDIDLPGIDEPSNNNGNNPGNTDNNQNNNPGNTDNNNPGNTEPTASANPSETPTATPTPSESTSPTPTPSPSVVSCKVGIQGDLNVLPNKEVELSAVVECDDASEKQGTFTWTSSDTNIATVNNGKVKGLKPGTVKITAKYNEDSKVTPAEVQFKVNNQCSISLTGELRDNPSLSLNSSKQLSAKVECIDGTTNTTNISWTTSDFGIATVNESGLVTGKKLGNATITATYRLDTNVSTSIDIKIDDPYGNDQLSEIGEQLEKPTGIDFRNGFLYVNNFDEDNADEGMIKVYDLSGKMLKEIAGTTFDLLPIDLTGVASDGSRVFSVSRFPYPNSNSGKNLFSFNVNGTNRVSSRVGLATNSSTDFQDLAIDPSSKNLYISSLAMSTIIRVPYDGSTIKATEQQLYFVRDIKAAGLCVDNLGNVWATNANNSTISKYGKDGTKALEFNTQGISSDGPIVTKIGDIAYDSRGNGTVYVLAQVNGQNKILRYDSNGKFVRIFGEGLQDPQSITVATDGKIYVTDKAKLKIHVFAPGK